MKTSFIFFVLLICAVLVHISGCSNDPVQGCTIPCATNFNFEAEEDDGSCRGCANQDALNSCSAGLAILTDDGSCILTGCTIACATNFDPEAEVNDGSCTGCTNTEATNFCSSIIADDGSCILSCETNQTGEVFFSNISNTNRTYDIIWDGVKIATVTPGNDSEIFTYAANIQHTLEFRFTNSTTLACTASTPVLSQCQRVFFNCTG